MSGAHQGRDRKPSHAWATKMLMLSMPNNAETISIITTVLYSLRRRNGSAGRTVKAIQPDTGASPGTDDFRQQSVSEKRQTAGASGIRVATFRRKTDFAENASS
jgi:hypothetical protein